MAVNPDPKPGRWILPLVILGMIGFTYFFVRALPEASTETTLVTGQESTTTTGNGGTATTQPGNGNGNIDNATQQYLNQLNEIASELQVLETELVAVNEGFDADPREVEFNDAGDRMDVVAADTQALADRVRELEVPAGLESNHESMQIAIDLCATAATEAVEGLRSSDEGDLRRAAVSAFVSSAADFDTELQNAQSAAGA
jgi:hypothetical protein